MKKSAIGEFFIVIISGFLLLSATPARGDATVIWTDSLFGTGGFDPATVVIGPGEMVTFQNLDAFGAGVQITFYAGLSFYLPDNSAQPVIFPSQPGVYGYYSDWGDNGAVIVNVAPTVSITAPANNAVFTAPATFTVQATAGDTADDAVSDVEFFLGTSDSTNSIEDVFSPPFSTGITNLDAGIYTLIAVARDSQGWTATNAITITVSAGAAVTLSSPRIAAGKFLFDVTGLTVGKTNLVQVSTNLASWMPVKTNIASSASMTVTNAATVARQFYRIFQLP